MPLYEYRCQKCGNLVERIEKFSGPHLKTCTRCRGKLERLMSAPAIQFKGTGWYVTDYARSSSRPSEEQGSAGSPDKSDKPDKPGKSDKGDAAPAGNPAEKKPATSNEKKTAPKDAK